MAARKTTTDITETETSAKNGEVAELKTNMITLANTLIRKIEGKEIEGSEYVSKIVEIYNAVK